MVEFVKDVHWFHEQSLEIMRRWIIQILYGQSALRFYHQIGRQTQRGRQINGTGNVDEYDIVMRIEWVQWFFFMQWDTICVPVCLTWTRKETERES